jgi:hypothetical protein
MSYVCYTLECCCMKCCWHACRVLSYSEADALATLDAAMPVCCPSSSLDALRSCVARGLPDAKLQVSKCALEGCWAADGHVLAGSDGHSDAPRHMQTLGDYMLCKVTCT